METRERDEPNLYWFNPLCDLAAGRGVFEPRLAVRALGDDLAIVPALLAAADDIVVVAERPGAPFLQMWQAAGLCVPELIVWDPLSRGLPGELAARKLNDLRPWGWAPDSVAALTSLAGQIPDAAAHPSKRWHEARRQLYAKTWSAAWLAQIIGDLRAAEGDWICDADVVGTSCDTQPAATQALTAGFAAGWTKAVIKAAFGAAGGQQMIVAAAALAPYQQHWLRRTLREAGCVVIEPWLDRQLDLSAQYEVDDHGCLRLLGVTR
ncbi:MAG: hypothetical protein O2782_11840, partial [bacterium]|nr:hypothetical protein [bacterium]